MSLTTAIAEAEAFLIQKDPQLGALIEFQKPIVHTPRANYFFSLCRSIVGQQVSVAAATTIFGRLEAMTGLDPTKVIRLSEKQIKEIGLSKQKAVYIHDLAEHFLKDPDVYMHLGQLSDEAVIEELIKVKGIGVWTAQMFLMFTLVRLDVFAPDDVGIQNAMKQLYGWKIIKPKQDLIKIAKRWAPYRSVASWHLWQSLQNTPQ